MDKGIKEDAQEISFTEETFNDFKKLYNESVKENKETFIFQNKTIFTKYGKYVIQHVKTNLSL